MVSSEGISEDSVELISAAGTEDSLNVGVSVMDSGTSDVSEDDASDVDDSSELDSPATVSVIVTTTVGDSEVAAGLSDELGSEPVPVSATGGASEDADAVGLVDSAVPSAEPESSAVDETLAVVVSVTVTRTDAVELSAVDNTGEAVAAADSVKVSVTVMAGSAERESAVSVPADSVEMGPSADVLLCSAVVFSGVASSVADGTSDSSVDVCSLAEVDSSVNSAVVSCSSVFDVDISADEAGPAAGVAPPDVGIISPDVDGTSLDGVASLDVDVASSVAVSAVLDIGSGIACEIDSIVPMDEVSVTVTVTAPDDSSAVVGGNVVAHTVIVTVGVGAMTVTTPLFPATWRRLSLMFLAGAPKMRSNHEERNRLVMTCGVGFTVGRGVTMTVVGLRRRVVRVRGRDMVGLGLTGRSDKRGGRIVTAACGLNVADVAALLGAAVSVITATVEV